MGVRVGVGVRVRVGLSLPSPALSQGTPHAADVEHVAAAAAAAAAQQGHDCGGGGGSSSREVPETHAGRLPHCPGHKQWGSEGVLKAWGTCPWVTPGERWGPSLAHPTSSRTWNTVL